MVSLEDKFGIAIFAAGWLGVVLTAPLVVVPVWGLVGVPAAGLGLAAMLTGLLVVKREAAGGTAVVFGSGLLFLAVLTLAIALFDTLQVTAPILRAQQLGLSAALSPGNGVRLLAEAVCLAGLTTAGVMLKGRWSVLHASALGLLSACTIPAVAAALSTYAAWGLMLIA